MSIDERRTERRRASVEAAATAAAGSREFESRWGEPLVPGDLLVLEAAGRWPLEWVVARRAGRGRGTLLLVPADTFPLVGRTDVAIDDPSASGTALVLRPRYQVEVGPERLDSAARSGRLAPPDVERLRFLLEGPDRESAGAAGDLDPGDEAAYGRWCEATLAPARAAVAAAYAPSRPAGPRARDWRAAGLAASAVVAVGLGWAIGAGFDRARLGEAQRANDALTTRLESATAAEREASARAAAAEERLAELEGERRSLAEPWANVPFAWLVPDGGAVRGEAAPVALRPDSPFVVLLLQLERPDRNATYRLDLLTPAGDRRALASGLALSGVAELSLTVPTALLPPGDLALELFAPDSGDERRIATYRLLVLSPLQRQSP